MMEFAEFDRQDITALLESTKLATGRGEGLHGADDVEINGEDGTIVYSTQKPLELRIGRIGDADSVIALKEILEDPEWGKFAVSAVRAISSK